MNDKLKTTINTDKYKPEAVSLGNKSILNSSNQPEVIIGVETRLSIASNILGDLVTKRNGVSTEGLVNEALELTDLLISKALEVK